MGVQAIKTAFIKDDHSLPQPNKKLLEKSITGWENQAIQQERLATTVNMIR